MRTWQIVLGAAVILGFGIPVTRYCGDNEVHTVLLFTVADWMVPGFDMCR